MNRRDWFKSFLFWLTGYSGPQAKPSNGGRSSRKARMIVFGGTDEWQVS